jgi:radical SAM modification target selenobiotic family peptide
MDLNDIKKILAGITIAGLLAGTALTVTSCKTTGSSS